MITEDQTPTPRQLAAVLRYRRTIAFGFDIAAHGADDRLGAEVSRYVAAESAARLSAFLRQARPSCSCSCCSAIHRRHISATN